MIIDINHLCLPLNMSSAIQFALFKSQFVLIDVLCSLTHPPFPTLPHSPHSLLARFWADPASYDQVDFRIRKILFLFACTNSCANPLIYGVFSARQGAACTGAAGLIASRERDFTSEQARRGWVRQRSACIAQALLLRSIRVCHKGTHFNS